MRLNGGQAGNADQSDHSILLSSTEHWRRWRICFKDAKQTDTENIYVPQHAHTI